MGKKKDSSSRRKVRRLSVRPLVNVDPRRGLFLSIDYLSRRLCLLLVIVSRYYFFSVVLLWWLWRPVTVLVV